MPKNNPTPGMQQAPSQVNVIVAACIESDPSLKGREDELREIVAVLLASKPDTQFDPAFAARLRTMLTERAETYSQDASPQSLSFWETMKNKPLVYALSGGAMLSLLLVAVLVRPKTQLETSSGTAAFSVAKQHIATVSDNGFGALTGGSAVTERTGLQMPEMAGGDSMSPNVSARPQSGGGGGTGNTGTLVSMAAPVPMDVTADSKMIVAPDYEPTNYIYTFKGELTLSDEKLGVYRHIKGISGDTGASSFSGMLNGLMNAGKLRNGRVQNVTMTEDREYGYTINVDAMEGTLSMSQNWQRWPHPEANCAADDCWRQFQVMGDQVPSDEELIAIADSFLTEYGIGGDQLGQPVVSDGWRVGMPMPLSAIVAPSSMSVVYPLTLEGEAVTDESGQPYGLTVMVNLREKRVDGLWGLATNRYERSSYDAETDAGRILSFVEKGAGYHWWNPEAKKTVEIELGEPTVVLSRYWQTDSNGLGYELYVPMLRFPVLNPPENEPWFRKAVMVPLAKELLNKMIDGQNGMPGPIIYLREGAAGAAVDTGTAVPVSEPAVMPEAAPAPMR